MTCLNCGFTIDKSYSICPKCNERQKENNSTSIKFITEMHLFDESIPAEEIHFDSINKEKFKNKKSSVRFISEIDTIEYNDIIENKNKILANSLEIINKENNNEELIVSQEIEFTEWDDNLTTTQNLQKKIFIIEKIIENIEEKKKKVTEDYLILKKDSEDKYSNEIERIEKELNETNILFVNKKNNNIQDMKLKLSELIKFENSIPLVFKIGYQKKSNYYPKVQNISHLNNILKSIQIPIKIDKKLYITFAIIGFFIGFLIRNIIENINPSNEIIDIFKNMSGLIPIFGGIIGAGSVYIIKNNLLKKKNNINNDLFDNIESGKVFINNCIENCNDEYSKLIEDEEEKSENRKVKIKTAYLKYINELEHEIDEKIKFLEQERKNIQNDPSFKNIKNISEPLYKKLGVTESINDEKFISVKDYPKEILLGMFGFSLFSNQILLPYTESMNSPIKLIISYEDDDEGKCKKLVMTGIQSLIVKLIKFMPLFSYTITYIDPNDRGSNLGILQKLSGITYFDVCRKVYTSRDNIQKRLNELEMFVDRTYETISGIDSVYENNKNNLPIVYHFIIINDFPDYFEKNSSSLESLKVLINNSNKCGISIIFTNKNNTTVDLPISGADKFKYININLNKSEIIFNKNKYYFEFDKLPKNCDKLLDNYKIACNEGIKIDNSFNKYFIDTENDTLHFEDSANKISVPFAVDSRGNLINFVLGSPLAAHALLSGTTGSGKSTTLHMLITSIIMKYKPDDVNIWLVDYKKVEFAEYIENTPPHVKIIGIERSKEFTYSLLDMINKEFQYRAEKFKKAGVNNISEYRTNNRKMPRIVLIIDEFHNMTQDIQNEPQYCQILENILSEYRVFGLSCIFSDQAISTGLRGLSDKGKMQMRTRLAMNNDFIEIRETLALDSVYYNDELKNKMINMGVGDVTMKCMIKDETSEEKIIIDKYKTILVTKDERKKIIKKINNIFGKTEEKPLIVDGQHRSMYVQEIIDKYEKQNKIIYDNQYPIYIGTPANLNPCFYFILRKKINANIMVIGPNDDLRAAVIYWSIFNFKKQNNSKIYIFADINDELYRKYKEKFLSLIDVNCILLTDVNEICNIANEQIVLLKSDKTFSFIVWLGLDNLTEKFMELPEKLINNENNKNISTLDNVNNMLEDIGIWEKENYKLNSDITDDSKKKLKDTDKNISNEKIGYNAIPDIQQLLEKGSRYGIFSIVTYSSYKSLNYTKYVKNDYFDHKIAFNMSLEESSSYLGRSSHASGLDDITAVYYDGIGPKIFRPYLI